MITQQNYYTNLPAIPVSVFTGELKETRELIDAATDFGKSWDMVNSDPDLEEVFKMYLTALNQEFDNGETKRKEKKKSPSKSARRAKRKLNTEVYTDFTLAKGKQILAEYKRVVIKDFQKRWTLDTEELIDAAKAVFEVEKVEFKNEKEFRVFVSDAIAAIGRLEELTKDIPASIRSEWKKRVELYWGIIRKADEMSAIRVRETRATKSKPSTKGKSRTRIDMSNAEKVELVDLELKFVRRYANMHGKEKTQNQIRLFLNALQKAIIEKRVRKTSPFAKEIREIQEGLITLFEALKIDESLTVKINEKKLAKYYKLLGKQMEMHSVRFIKSYVNLQGKLIENKRAVSLHDRIVRAFNSEKITKRDRYWHEIESILSNLKSFIKKNKKDGILSASEKELNGLNGILESCSCSELSGVNVAPRNVVMRSTDFVKLKFDKLGFSGKWLDFIGNPARGFKAMTFGLPKMGKSYLMVDFAGYLVRNHGTVLYVAKEETLDATLQKKLKDMDADHPDLYLSDHLPNDLSPYDFVFLDSVTKLRLSPEDLENLAARYPKISFIYVFQTTKHGEFRGSNEFQHDVDVVIEVPEKGKAIQFGRFNQGGEIDIFSNPNSSVAA